MEDLMKTIRFILGSILFVAFFSTVSMAQNGRTFVSGGGLDTNPCSVTSPCRTFGQAISVTNAGGEVIVLTSAGYGPFTITKAVTVEAPAGVYAGVTVSSGNGITINATAGVDTVTLRGLTVNNQGSTGNGIVFNTGGTLHVESCIANGFSSGGGIDIAGPGNIFVDDTIARGNTYGVLANIPTTGTASISMVNLHSDANTYGLFLEAAATGVIVNAAIRSSSASGNTTTGMLVEGVTNGVASLDIESCLVTDNGTGVFAQGITSGTGTASISNCTITRNSTSGFDQESGGVINSRGQNTIIGSNTGTLTALPGQ
jgi:hypothetical protein